MAAVGRDGRAYAKKATGSNAFIVKSLTLVHSRRSGPKVLHPNKLEGQPKLLCITLRDTPIGGGTSPGGLMLHFTAQTWKNSVQNSNS